MFSWLDTIVRFYFVCAHLLNISLSDRHYEGLAWTNCLPETGSTSRAAEKPSHCSSCHLHLTVYLNNKGNPVAIHEFIDFKVLGFGDFYAYWSLHLQPLCDEYLNSSPVFLQNATSKHGRHPQEKVCRRRGQSSLLAFSSILPLLPRFLRVGVGRGEQLVRQPGFHTSQPLSSHLFTQ